MRQARLGLLLAGALLCSACFQFSTVLRVKGDGSGTIEQRLLFTPAAVAQLRQFAALAGGGKGFDPVSEQQARDAAATLGSGVTYVSSTPINSSEGVGRDIRYAFADINKLSLDQAPPTPGGLSIGPSVGAGGLQISFNLARQADGHALLTVRLPQLPFVSGGNGSPLAGSMPSADQMAMLKPMLAGAKISIVIEPDGPLVRTSSPYVTGPRVTMMDISIDSLLNDNTLLPRLQAAKNADEAKTILASIPGLQVNLDPETTIEFTPR